MNGSNNLWYINEGLFIIFNNINRVRVMGCSCINIDLVESLADNCEESFIVVEKSDFINKFFSLFHTTIKENYVRTSYLRLISFLVSNYGYQMREVFLNSELLKVLTFKDYFKRIDILYLFKIYVFLVSFNYNHVDNFLINNGGLKRIVELSLENRNTGIEDLFNNLYKNGSINIKNYINLQLKYI